MADSSVDGVTLAEASIAHSIDERKRTNDVLIADSIDFAGLLLSENVLKGLKSSGFERPSPIQLKAIPLGRCGLDLIVQAKSGTGKTCVFSVISLESLQTESFALQVLVLAPTREIAIQIWEVIRSIGKAVPDLICHTFIGGMPVQEDRQKLKKCHIAVGTPGRIKQLIENSILSTENIRMFILDEADKLLEESFQEQINWIYSSLPDNKQMLALSATYPEYLAQHLTAYMRNPTFLRLNVSDPALLGIKQFYRVVPYHPLPHKLFENKTKLIVEILSSIHFQQCLVFSNLQTRAQNLAEALTNLGWPTACIAGSYDQKERNEAMSRLKTYKCRVLISTDLTSRGIDANRVDMVINLDVPKDHETYLHRIGRAGRFGTFGAAVSVVSAGQEEMDLRLVEQQCNTHIQLLPDPIPADLPKSECKITLDDVVSTKQIITSPENRKKFFQKRKKWKDKEKFRNSSKAGDSNGKADKQDDLANTDDQQLSGVTTSLEQPQSSKANGKHKVNDKMEHRLGAFSEGHSVTDNGNPESGVNGCLTGVEKKESDEISAEHFQSEVNSLGASVLDNSGGILEDRQDNITANAPDGEGNAISDTLHQPPQILKKTVLPLENTHHSTGPENITKSVFVKVKKGCVSQGNKVNFTPFQDAIDYKRIKSPHSYESAKTEYMAKKNNSENQQTKAASIRIKCPASKYQSINEENIVGQIHEILKSSTLAVMHQKLLSNAGSYWTDEQNIGIQEIKNGGKNMLVLQQNEQISLNIPTENDAEGNKVLLHGNANDASKPYGLESVKDVLKEGKDLKTKINTEDNLKKENKHKTSVNVYSDVETCVGYYGDDEITNVAETRYEDRHTESPVESQLEHCMEELVLGIHSHRNRGVEVVDDKSDSEDTDEDSSSSSEYSSHTSLVEDEVNECNDDYADADNFVYEVYDDYADEEPENDQEFDHYDEHEFPEDQWDSSGYATLHSEWNPWGFVHLGPIHYPLHPWFGYPNYPWVSAGYGASHYGPYSVPVGCYNVPYCYPAYTVGLQQQDSMQRHLKTAMENQQKYIKYMMQKS